GGFFSPAPPQPSLEAVRLACGAPVPGDATVRLVASCVALQAKLRWGRYGRDVELHLEGLRRIVDLWDARDGLFTMPGFVAAVAALADAPDPESREAAARGIATLVGAQRADGTWPDVDLFQVMELLERAARTDNATPAVNAALHRSAVMLAVSIQEDGTWGLHAGTRRTLIGWRVLRYAARMQEKKSGCQPRASPSQRPSPPLPRAPSNRSPRSWRSPAVSSGPEPPMDRPARPSPSATAACCTSARTATSNASSAPRRAASPFPADWSGPASWMATPTSCRPASSSRAWTSAMTRPPRSSPAASASSPAPCHRAGGSPAATGTTSCGRARLCRAGNGSTPSRPSTTSSSRGWTATWRWPTPAPSSSPASRPMRRTRPAARSSATRAPAG